MDTALPLSLLAVEGAGIVGVVLLQRTEEIRSPALSKEISVIRWRADRHSSCAPREVVAQVEREALELIGGEANIVLDDGVMCRPRGALEALMSLEVELTDDTTNDSAIHDGTRLRVPRSSATVWVRIGVLW